PQPSTLQHPDRLVIDLPQTVVLEPRRLSVSSHGVKAVRVAQLSEHPPVARVVVDLTSPLTFQLVSQGDRLLVKLAAEQSKKIDAPAPAVHQPTPKSSSLSLVPAAAAASLTPTRTTATPPGNGVGCLGRIEPEDGVLQVTGGYLEGRPQRVRELKVKENDFVHAGQLLAVLDGKDQLETALRLAEARVELSRSRLAQVNAGASASEIAAQQAQVEEIKADLQNARAEYKRYQELRQNTDVSPAELDARSLAVKTAEQKLAQAQERLKAISEVRPTNVAVAESELHVAEAEADHARAQLRTALVSSPVNGRVLAIHAYPGEELGPRGLLDLGKTDSMYVRAEVYEDDIARVHVGQQAYITSDLFPGQISGVVDTVGSTISKNNVLPLDPVSFADARVFNVRIRLDHASDVANFIHAKVNVVIHP
ncbi:MAG: AMIN domain-containing protein, partial [Acidobacteriaceae bacterium]|nr:AMIN domain-containing protein [Acidobacteriaceae bacterium]